MGPKCDQCELSDGLCPSAKKTAKASSSSKRQSKKTLVASSDIDRVAGPKIEVKLEEEEVEEDRLRKDKIMAPFGEGSLHTTTARWVAAQLLPKVQWYNQGRICDGIGFATKLPEG